MRRVGKTKRTTAETRALAARAALTVARGQCRDREMYCGSRISERTAKLLRQKMARTVKVGFGVKGIARKVRRERVREVSIKPGMGVWKLVD